MTKEDQNVFIDNQIAISVENESRGSCNHHHSKCLISSISDNKKINVKWEINCTYHRRD